MKIKKGNEKKKTISALIFVAKTRNTSHLKLDHHLTLLLRIGVRNTRADSFEAPILTFSLSAAFFISSSLCLQFSSWDLMNILTKLSKVETTAAVS